MKNVDMPAMPLTGDSYTDFAGHLNKGNRYEPECLGVTNRESAAFLIMANLMGKDHGYVSWSDMALDTIDATDALLAALEKTK